MRQQTATSTFLADATTAPVHMRRRLLQGACLAAAWPAAWAAKDTLGGEVRLGQSIALTGPLGDLGQALLQGAKAHFDAVNAKGGINGRRIELVTQDDGYDVKRAVANVDGFIADSSTFALFNCFGTPMCEAVLPTVVAAGIPFFAPFTVELSLRVKERSVFNIRASYPDEAEQLVKHLSTLGIKRVAVAYQNNSFGKEVFEGVRVAADKYQVSGIESATVENTGADAAAAATKLLAGNPDAILVPKVARPGDIVNVSKIHVGMGGAEKTRMWAMMETPMAIFNVREIASVHQVARLSCFVLGTNDLLKESRALATGGRFAILPWLSMTLLAARAYGLDVIDGVYNDFRDEPGFRAECEQGRTLGMDGKTLIHPGQIAACNEMFSPASEEVAWAHKIIDAFKSPENAAKGVITVDGKMVERLHLAMAERVAAIAEAIS